MTNLIATSAKTEIIKHLFTVLENGPNHPIKASDEYVTFLTKDAKFRLGNVAPLIGHEAIKNSLMLFCQQVKSIDHDIKQKWEVEENFVFLDMEVTYCRIDGTSITLPVMNVFQFKDDLIQELRIFMDINSVFA